MSIKILVVDDLLDMLDDADSLQERHEITMKVVAHKFGYSTMREQADDILAELKACSGGKHTACVWVNVDC